MLLELFTPRRKRRGVIWQIIGSGVRHIIVDGQTIEARDIIEINDREVKYVDAMGNIRVLRRRARRG